MFTSLLAAIKGGILPLGRAAQQRQRNQDETLAKLYSILELVTEHNVQDEIKDMLPNITQAAADLALNIGAQRAQLSLVRPEPGISVIIGDEFLDCMNGDTGKGKSYTLDLLVSPALVKIGNGKGDMTTRKVLVAAEVFTKDDS